MNLSAAVTPFSPLSFFHSMMDSFRLLGRAWRALLIACGIHGVLLLLLLVFNKPAVVLPLQPVIGFEVVSMPVTPPAAVESLLPQPVAEESPPVIQEPPSVVEELTPVVEEPLPVSKPVYEEVLQPVREIPVPVQKPLKVRKRRVVPSPVVSPTLSPPVLPPSSAVTEGYRPLDVRAAYASNPQPVYPRMARRMGYEGTVLLRVEVNSSGGVQQVEIERSSGFESLDQAAVKAVRGWRFLPAQRFGRGVAARVQVPIRFRLESE